MTKREAMRQAQQLTTLTSLGFTVGEAEQLRRISMTLHRWFEHECNGTIQRDDDGNGKPFYYFNNDRGDSRKYPVADRERGALKRLAGIVKKVNQGRHEDQGFLSTYIQGDPRGAALYIIRPGDVPAGADVGAYYSRGICVY